MNAKCGALTRLRLDPNPAAVHLNNALRYGEAQAGAALLADELSRGGPMILASVLALAISGMSFAAVFLLGRGWHRPKIILGLR